MFTTSFWPAAPAYQISMMDLDAPENLSPKALQTIHYCLRLTEAINQLEAAWIQFNYLREHGCIELSAETLDFHPALFYPQMADLTRLMARLGTTNDMIEYNQLIKRVPL